MNESSSTNSSDTADGRAKPRLVTGFVVSDKMNKTITVRQERMVKHPLYGKYIRRASTYKAHDEKNEAGEGDLVEIRFTRPQSKTKCWSLIKVIRRARLSGAVVTGASEVAGADGVAAESTPVEVTEGVNDASSSEEAVS